MNSSQTIRSRVSFYVDRKSLLIQASLIIMAMAASFRLLGLFVPGQSEFTVVTELILPIACNILFILSITLFPKKLFLSALPVIFGVVFFIVKSFGFESWLHTILCIILYIVVAIVYTATVFGVIRTKWLLAPLFALPLLYHIFVEDLAALRDTANPVTFVDGMLEMSVLCIMLSLLLAGLAFKKDKPIEEQELPKIKDPVVIPPESKPETPDAESLAESVETAVPCGSSAPEMPQEIGSTPETPADSKQAEGTAVPTELNTKSEGTEK